MIETVSIAARELREHEGETVQCFAELAIPPHPLLEALSFGFARPTIVDAEILGEIRSANSYSDEVLLNIENPRYRPVRSDAEFKPVPPAIQTKGSMEQPIGLSFACNSDEEVRVLK